MRKKTFSLVVASLGLLSAVSSAFANDEINMIIQTMNNEEKARFVTGSGMNNAEKVPGAAGSTNNFSHLGFPQIVFADGPAGVRLGAGPTGGEARYSTAFPIPSLLSASWNQNLVYKVAQAMGEEAKDFGIDVLLAPAVNLQRNPLNGRNFEYFSEDPFLSSRIGAAFVNGVQSTGVAAAVKHFVANNQESYRHFADLQIPERALRELYLANFEYIIKEAKPLVVMSAYPSVNGEFASQNTQLLTHILRDEWGYEGAVISDWYGENDPVKAIIAGNDLIMPGGKPSKRFGVSEEQKAPEIVLLDALNSGELTQDHINVAITRVANLIQKTLTYKGNLPAAPDFDKHAKIAREAAAEGMVLLKNNGETLPLKAKSRVALYALDTPKLNISGGGSAEVNADPRRITPIKTALQNANINVVETASGIRITPRLNDRLMRMAVELTDTAVIVLNRFSTEGADRYSMATTQDEIDMIRHISNLYHEAGKKVVVLLNVGEPIETIYWDDDVDAILLTWLPGQEGSNAIADILAGKIAPSGKLPLTFPKYAYDAPTSINFPGNREHVLYGEGIYMGYRYYDAKHINVLYPFGHGLSYTTFYYNNIRADNPAFDLDRADTFTFNVDVTNDGNVPAQEVVQFYLHDVWASVDRPYQELKGFQKIALKPDETKTVTFTVDKKMLSFFDPMTHKWTYETGKFVARIGSSSRDIRLELPIDVISLKPTITRSTPWLALQTNEYSAEIIAQFIGTDQTNSWVAGLPTLEEQLGIILESMSEFKGKKEKQNELIDKIIEALNHAL